ncbi:MAG: peptidylprolyl isomerase [Deltaproteobacteria bacterium]|nr:peptidylprolyl isomerase [Deltaproteobacteria bacterium]
MKIEKSSFVTIDYLIRMGEQETYPPSGQPEEISFCMGWGAMPPGMEEAMIGLEQGDQKVVHLSAEQAYGEFDQELVMEVPRADFAPDLELKPGLVFETENDEGQAVYFIVQEVKDDVVIIDFNHPLAGKDLEVTLSVRQVREATPEDLAGHESQEGCSCSHCGEGGSHSH